MDPVVVNTVSKCSVSEETEILASGLLIKLSFLHEKNIAVKQVRRMNAAGFMKLKNTYNQLLYGIIMQNAHVHLIV